MRLVSPPASSSAARAVMRGNRSKDTVPEVAARQALHAAGLRYRKHVRPLAGLRCEADVVFRREQVAVFIDGCFWHGCPDHGRVPKGNNHYWEQKLGRNLSRDRRNDEVLASAGWLVLRFWEHEPAVRIVDAVIEALNARR